MHQWTRDLWSLRASFSVCTWKSQPESEQVPLHTWLCQLPLSPPHRHLLPCLGMAPQGVLSSVAGGCIGVLVCDVHTYHCSLGAPSLSLCGTCRDSRMAWGQGGEAGSVCVWDTAHWREDGCRRKGWSAQRSEVRGCSPQNTPSQKWQSAQRQEPPSPAQLGTTVLSPGTCGWSQRESVLSWRS